MGSCPNLVTFCHFFNREFSRFEHLAAPISCTPLGISSMALLQNKSLFQVLRVDFLTLVFPKCSSAGLLYAHHD